MTTKNSGAAKTVSDPAPGTKTEASGAIIEPAIVDAVDTRHPAVDDNPRDGTSAEQNRIDFNDPNKRDEEAVADNLKAQK